MQRCPCLGLGQYLSYYLTFSRGKLSKSVIWAPLREKQCIPRLMLYGMADQGRTEHAPFYDDLFTFIYLCQSLNPWLCEYKVQLALGSIPSQLPRSLHLIHSDGREQTQPPISKRSHQPGIPVIRLSLSAVSSVNPLVPLMPEKMTCFF